MDYEVQAVLIMVWDTIKMMGMDKYLIASMVIMLVFFVIGLMAKR